MPDFAFAPRPQPALPISGSGAVYPVARIFCVGRNYAAHAAEMGNEVDREAPFYFTKSCHALLAGGGDMPYPPGTADLHHEAELVVALGEGGQVFGHAAGLDMTRRDLQAAAKDKRRPWDVGKDFENAAIIGAITPGALAPDARVSLRVGRALRQDAPVSDMVWSVPEILAHLGGLYALGPGDLIMTGTPAGVAAVVRGDVLTCEVTGLAPVSARIV